MVDTDFCNINIIHIITQDNEAIVKIIWMSMNVLLPFNHISYNTANHIPAHPIYTQKTVTLAWKETHLVLESKPYSRDCSRKNHPKLFTTVRNH